jgi:hypothetical protein
LPKKQASLIRAGLSLCANKSLRLFTDTFRLGTGNRPEIRRKLPLRRKRIYADRRNLLNLRRVRCVPELSPAGPSRKLFSNFKRACVDGIHHEGRESGRDPAL